MSIHQSLRRSLMKSVKEAIATSGVPDTDYFSFERHADEAEYPDKNLYGISNLNYETDYHRLVNGQVGIAVSSVPSDRNGLLYHDPMIDALLNKFRGGSIHQVYDHADPQGEDILGTFIISGDVVVLDYDRTESRTIQRVVFEIASHDPTET